MGIFSAKCSKCWDPMPCGCGDTPADQEIRLLRAANAAAREQAETNRLLKEQNELIREQNRLMKKK